jgi:hypothetical protein
MFRKLDFKFNDDVIKKTLYLTRKINSLVVLDHNPVEKYKFIDYDEQSDEYYLLSKFKSLFEQMKSSKNASYDHSIIDFPWKKIISFLPCSLLSVEVPVVRWQRFKARSTITPHVDMDRLCTINLYLSVSDETTVFYTKKRSGVNLQTLDGHLTNENFIYEWLDKHDSFIAKLYDIYLLNVNQPHEVINTTDKDRISLQFSFKKTPFDVVNKLIK